MCQLVELVKSPTYPDVKLVRQPLVQRHRELAEVVAVVGGEQEVGVVHQAVALESLGDLGDHLVHRHEGPPAVPEHFVHPADCGHRHLPGLAHHQPVLGGVLAGVPVEGLSPGGARVAELELVIGGRSERGVAGGGRQHHEERGLGVGLGAGGVVGQELDSLPPQYICKVVSPVVVAVVLCLPVDGEGVVVILGVPHQPHPPVPARGDVLVSSLLLPPVLVQVFPAKHRPVARSLELDREAGSLPALPPLVVITATRHRVVDNTCRQRGINNQASLSQARNITLY